MKGIPEIPEEDSLLALLLPVPSLLCCLVAEHFGSLIPPSEIQANSRDQVSFSSIMYVRYLVGV